MSWLLIAALAIIVVLALVVMARTNAGTGDIGYPYVPSRWLFSDAERSFLGVLDQAVGQEHRVLGKVRLGDLAQVKSGLSRSAQQGALNRVASKHIDFVVCRASDLIVVCAVELNDKSHASKRAQSRDELVAKVCSAISLPLIVFPAKHAYVVSEVRDAFVAATRTKVTPPAIGT